MKRFGGQVVPREETALPWWCSRRYVRDEGTGMEPAVERLEIVLLTIP